LVYDPRGHRSPSRLTGRGYCSALAAGLHQPPRRQWRRQRHTQAGRARSV